MQPCFSVPASEKGYVLINVIWLLLLAASIIALIVQSGKRLDNTVRSESELVRLHMALESALDSAIFDITTPAASGKSLRFPLVKNYMIAGLSMQVTIVNEAGKLDINHAEPELIRRGLQGLGVPGYVASNLSLRLTENRKSRKQIATLEGLDDAFSAAGLDFGSFQFCARKYLTPFSGHSQPELADMRQELLRALNIPKPAATAKSRLINAVAIKVSTKAGPSLFARVRLGQLNGRPYQIMHFNRASECGI